jgi:UDP-N-acetylmuramoyl-tripeptide--D-alanyl-D-alanine ligase
VPNIQIPQLVVEDAVLALQKISAFWRDQQTLSSCVLVTGSNGKTSVKEMLKACFAESLGQDQVCATLGNLNNHLGLPLSLLSLREAHQVGVFEVGANHLSEIAQLAPLASPTVAMITSIGWAHVGEFGGLSAIKQAKGEIFSALPDGGLAVVPVLAVDGADVDVLDGWYDWQAQLARLSPVVFGEIEVVKRSRGWKRWLGLVETRIVSDGENWWQVLQLDSSDWGSHQLTLPLLGRHQAMNAVAVSAVLLAQGVSWSAIQLGLAKLSVPSGRLCPISLLPNCLIIDDSYNANPSSMIAGIQVLAEVKADVRILVLGDMAELGDSAEAGHRLVGLSAREQAIDQVFALGNYVSDYETGFGQRVEAFSTHEALAKQLWHILQGLMEKQQSIALLVKGSRSSRMEQVITQLHVYRDLRKNTQ